MTIIYSITSGKGDKVYIGRTEQTLERRISSHKTSSNPCNSKLLLDEYGFENCIFTVVEECEEEQGPERERYHIENTSNVINIRLPGRTRKAHREDNKEHGKKIDKAYRESHKEQRKAYYEANKEQLKAYYRAYRAKKKSIE
jgi:hypothetical protein